jgi:hypothetical protein
VVRYFSGNGQYFWDKHRLAEVGALLLFGVAAAITTWRLRRNLFSGMQLLVVLWFGFACLGPFAIDVLRGTFVADYPRYESAAMPAACLLGGWMLANVGVRLAIALLVGIGLCWAPSVASIYKKRSRVDQPMRDVARHLSHELQAEDLVLVHSIPSGAILVARYLTTPAPLAVWTGQLGQRRVPDSIASLVAGRRHVVLVKVHTVGEPAPEETWLRQNGRLIKSKQLGTVFIDEYSPIRDAMF